MIDRWLASVIAWGARAVTGASVDWRAGELGSGPTVFVANHSSHADFVLLWSSLPRELRRSTRPVAARDYWGEGIARYLADRVFRSVLIDRGSPCCTGVERKHTAVGQMADAMGESGALILFPEGTRSPDGRIGPFRAGLFHLCVARPGLQVVPVRLVNLNRVLPKGEVVPLPLLSRVVVAPPIFLQEGESQTAFLERVRQAVVSLA
ncbi:MAG: 1-acyl-sn-glycerol-3-phosphate acyltransferase [Candidatus Dormibacteraeota bacterium]|nr:1-acyl-sn-glycerol-3-phosphate acyltransferase [Candidatus Dormibacteraeota bacterium]